MTDDPDPIREAYDALRAKGHAVEPDADFTRWQVDGEWLDDRGLLSLAIRLGLMDAVERVQ